MDPAVPLLSPVPACELRPACLSLHSCGLRCGRLQEEERTKTAVCGPGVFQVYTAKYFADLADFGPKPADFHGVSSGNYREETRGCCRETPKRRGERGNMYTYSLKLAATVATWEGAARWSLRFSKISLRERWNRNLPASTEICCRLLLLLLAVFSPAPMAVPKTTHQALPEGCIPRGFSRANACRQCTQLITPWRAWRAIAEVAPGARARPGETASCCCSGAASGSHP